MANNNNAISQIEINNITYDLIDAQASSDIKNLQSTIENLNNIIFPIGYIYISVDSTNPTEWFGGTWVQISGRFLVACGNNGATGVSNLNLSAGSTGGEATHVLTPGETATKAHTHTLSNHTHTTNIGAHSHSVTTNAASAWNIQYVGGNQLKWWRNVGAGGTNTDFIRGDFSGKTSADVEFKIPSLGGTANSTTIGNKISGGPSNNSTGSLTAANGTAHNNMPPYLAVYMWKRTA